MTREELNETLEDLCGVAWSVGEGLMASDREVAIKESILAAFDALTAELAAIKAALPKTADGETIVPGMDVWEAWPEWYSPETVSAVNKNRWAHIGKLGQRELIPARYLYRRHPETGLTVEETEATKP